MRIKIMQAKKFIRFLKEQKSCNSYFANFISSKRAKIHSIEDIYAYFLREKPLFYVVRAFYWDSTKEGFDYWHNIHKTYKENFFKNNRFL